MSEFEKQKEAKVAVTHVLEVMREKIHNDLKIKSKEEVMADVSEAGFDNKALDMLYEYCLEKEDYEVCGVLKDLYG
jgi:hypothetical protein